MTQLQKYTQTKEYLARNESPKIRGVNRKDFQPLIVQCCKLIGIRNDNIPQGIVTDLLHNFTIENLKSYTYDEILLAFKYVASGKIKVKDHFQDFSPIYLSLVMTGYTEYLSRNNVDITPPEVIKTQQQKDKEKKEAEIHFIDFIIEDVTTQKVSWVSSKPLYDLLKSFGYFDFTKEEKIKIFKEAKNEYIFKKKPFKTESSKENFKLFCSNNQKGEHFENVMALIKENNYQNFVFKNKGVNLEELKAKLLKKLNERQKQNS